MPLEAPSLPGDLAAAHAMILAERAARLEAEARARDAEAEVSGVRLEIERLRLLLAKARRERYGQSSERGARLIEQLELQLAELEEGVAEEETAAEIAAPVMEPATRPRGAGKPARRPLPEHLPRERIVYPVPCTCPRCGGPVRRLGEDITETLECEPRRWKVVEHVREKVSCRACEAISQPPAPSHPIARGRAGPNLLALVLAKERTRIGRLWVYVRDDRPFAGPAPPAAAFFYSPDREGSHPERHLAGFAGLLQADAYGGFNRLYEPGREPGPILEAACWAHARRKLYELAALGKAPIAAEAVRRIDRLFAVERDIAGLSAEARLAVRGERSAAILAELEPWLRQQRERLSRKSEVGKAIAYTTRRWEALTRFMGDGRICLTNNAAERALRGVAVGRRNWTFAGSDRGGERAAAVYTLVETAKLNGIDPQAWLADVLARIADHPARRITALLPWHWRAERLVPPSPPGDLPRATT